MIKKKNVENKNNEKKLKLENLYVAKLGESRCVNRYYEFSASKTAPYVLVYYKQNDGWHEKCYDAITKSEYKIWDQNTGFCAVIVNPAIQYFSNLKHDLEYIDLSVAKELLFFLNYPEEYKSREQKEKEELISNQIVLLPQLDLDDKKNTLKEDILSDLFLSLASKQKNTVIVGEEGVGKTTLINQLASLINNGNVPEFLKNRPVIQIKSSGLRFFEENLDSQKTLFKWIRLNKPIILFDDIEELFQKENELGKTFFDKVCNIDKSKVIVSATPSEYKKYYTMFKNFENINLEEPDLMLLYDINLATLYKYSEDLNISLPDQNKLDNICNTLITLTNRANRKIENFNARVETNKISNPKLCVDIIDKAFAYALVEDSKTLKIKHVKKAIQKNKYFEQRSIDEAITNLKEEKVKVKKLK